MIDLEQSSPLLDPRTAPWLDGAQGRDLVLVPLAVAGVLSGALVLLGTVGRERYTEQDVAFLEDAAARAGAAVANARAHQLQRQVAINLQRALLPDAPPPLQGLKVAARYLAGGDDVEVGGDWWDVHDLGAGRVGVGVGDVSGRGVPAAIVMGQARSGMRAAAHADLPPADLLTVLDAQVGELVSVEHTDDHALQPRFATAAYAVLEAFDQTLRLANAGHPPLLVRDPTGAVRRVAAPPGPPLGLGGGRGYEETVVDFPAGSLLLAFTDGLVESSRVDIDSGIERLAEDLAAVDVDADLDEVADRLLTRGAGADDVALVLLRSDPARLPVERYSATLEQMSDVSRTRRELTGLADTAHPGTGLPGRARVGRAAGQRHVARRTSGVGAGARRLRPDGRRGGRPVRLRAAGTGGRGRRRARARPADRVRAGRRLGIADHPQRQGDLGGAGPATGVLVRPSPGVISADRFRSRRARSTLHGRIAQTFCITRAGTRPAPRVRC